MHACGRAGGWACLSARACASSTFTIVFAVHWAHTASVGVPAAERGTANPGGSPFGTSARHPGEASLPKRPCPTTRDDRESAGEVGDRSPRGEDWTGGLCPQICCFCWPRLLLRCRLQVLRFSQVVPITRVTPGCAAVRRCGAHTADGRLLPFLVHHHARPMQVARVRRTPHASRLFEPKLAGTTSYGQPPHCTDNSLRYDASWRICLA